MHPHLVNSVLSLFSSHLHSPSCPSRFLQLWAPSLVSGLPLSPPSLPSKHLAGWTASPGVCLSVLPLESP